jgi:isoleucyl-tRNA synthetase
MLQVSSFTIVPAAPCVYGWSFESEVEIMDSECEVIIAQAEGSKCPRCWTYAADEEGELCERCSAVLGLHGK